MRSLVSKQRGGSHATLTKADASPSSLYPSSICRYEIILDEDGAVVGQIISDGVAVTLSDASKSLLAPVELCASRRARRH